MRKQLHAAEFELEGGGTLIISPTHARDVVVVQGSVLGGPNMFPIDEKIIPGLVSTLLDAGTKSKSKAVLREGLAARGMSLGFSAIGDRTNFSGQCFPEDLGKLLGILTECLGAAAFPEVELKNAKAVLRAELEEEKSDTAVRAERALAYTLYDSAHPNYARPLDEVAKSLEHIRRVHLQKFQQALGRKGLIVVVAGDVDVDTTRRTVEKVIGRLPLGSMSVPTKVPNTTTARSTEELVHIHDKANVDVRLGAALPLTLRDSLYLPLYVVVQMLGGGTFDTHLMKTIRDRDGLTYGVYAQLLGFTKDTDGYFRVAATFSPLLFDQAVAALRREVKIFFDSGLTREALMRTQERLTGAYQVSLSTTANLANTLHAFAKNGFGVSYLTEYPELLQQVTLADIKKAAELVPLDKLALAASGTFVKK
jgi:zinc protease